MSQQLQRAGCIVHVANHGLECLNFLETSTYCSSTTPLSVILLDLEVRTPPNIQNGMPARLTQFLPTYLTHTTNPKQTN